MTDSSARRILFVGALSVMACLALAACGKAANARTASDPVQAGGASAPSATSTGGVETSAAATPSARPVASAPPATYFADGKTYDAWILSINKNGTLVIGLVHHLTGDDAKNYLTSHGQTVPPDGISNDYINVDTYVHKTVEFSPSAKVVTNPQGLAQPMSANAFLSTYLPDNLAQPIAPGDQDTYPGAPHYFGALYALTFHDDVIDSVDQIFEP